MADDRPRALIPGVHSNHSNSPSFVNFKNCTNSDVDVIWIDYNGAPVVYRTLPSSGKLKCKTYETHKWVFRNKHTLEKLQVNYQDIFNPISFENFQAASGHPIKGPVSPLFSTQFIHYPLYSLMERASQVIIRCLSNPDQAFDLDIPVTLKNFVADAKLKHELSVQRLKELKTLYIDRIY